MITMRVTGIKVNQREMMALARQAVIDPLEKCALLVEREAKRLLNVGAPVTGKSKSGKTTYYQPSTPPDPPHKRLTALQTSINYALLTFGGKRGAIVGPTEKYGKTHEFGLDFGARNYPKRPFMRPALRRVNRKFPAKFKRML